MTLHIATDSDGNDYQVWAQRQLNSCAAAAMWMAECQAKQMTLLDGEWQKAIQIYGSSPNTGPMTIVPTQHARNQDTFQNQWSRFGTYPNQIKNALERQGLSVIAEATTPGLKINLITQSTQAIVLVGWMVNNRGVLTRNGGHFIVAVNVNSRNQIVFLDPGDGTLLESGNNGRYQSNGRMEFSLYISKA